jgi:hypothetical protein
MNPYRIYRDEWAKALATQAMAPEYTIFVAMPFEEKFSYRSREILERVIRTAAREANNRKEARRPFTIPERVDVPAGAVVITEQIISGILESHFFLGDLTSQNAGVILEAGIALGTKPNRQVILITQGPLSDLHFDLRNNKVISYNPDDSVAQIASAFISAASAFEEQVQHNILSVTRMLSPEAILALNWYGRLQLENKAKSLHAQNIGPYFEGPNGLSRFDAATRELRDKGLLWTDYVVGAVPGGDAYGMHATEFGWAVIANMWSGLQRNRNSA